MMYQIDNTNIEIRTPACVRSELTSLHGLLRTMERTGMNEPQALRLIRNAWIRGTDAQQLPRAWQRSSISRMIRVKPDGRTIARVYRNYLFIFSQSGVLITLLLLPGNFFRKRVYDDAKKPVRNVRRYLRMHDEEDALCA